MTVPVSLPNVPPSILDALKLAHPEWHSALSAGVLAVAQSDPAYLDELAQGDFLPNGGRLFAAFSQPLSRSRYVLVGEGPYPRADSATGVCFMDGAVKELWSENGLSKKVNRATSLRNFMKMLLVADGQLSASNTTSAAMAVISAHAQSGNAAMIQTLAELQDNLHKQGFLLLNATLVYRPHVPPAKESRAWQPFLQTVLNALATHARQRGNALPKLVLWGKIAERLAAMPEAKDFPHALSEHPYNLTFITNPVMQKLFAPMRLLQKSM